MARAGAVVAGSISSAPLKAWGNRTLAFAHTSMHATPTTEKQDTTPSLGFAPFMRGSRASSATPMRLEAAGPLKDFCWNESAQVGHTLVTASSTTAHVPSSTCVWCCAASRSSVTMRDMCVSSLCRDASEQEAGTLAAEARVAHEHVPTHALGEMHQTVGHTTSQAGVAPADGDAPPASASPSPRFLTRSSAADETGLGLQAPSTPPAPDAAEQTVHLAQSRQAAASAQLRDAATALRSHAEAMRAAACVSGRTLASASSQYLQLIKELQHAQPLLERNTLPQLVHAVKELLRCESGKADGSVALATELLLHLQF